MDTQLRDSSSLITGERELEDVCARLAGHQWVGVDTEFLRERTYFAKLCLVQLSADGFECAVDVLALDSLEPLAALLDSSVQKVLHAARQDFEVLYQSCGAIPVATFDTQVAAAFCGYPDQIGYAGLVRDEFGVELAKHQTRTDWSQRPLSPAQMEYALADVRYLGDLRGRLESRLMEGGKMDWFRDEMLDLARMEYYEIDPEQSYKRVKGGNSLDAGARAVLKVLAAWRENRARKSDLPRSWVLSDANLVAIARLDPVTVDDLARCEDLKAGFIRRHGENMVNMIKEASGVAGELELATRLRPLAAAERKQGSALMKIVAARAVELDMAASLLATRKDVEALVRAGDDDHAVEACAVMSGWRREVIGTVLAGKFRPAET
jgi:ribonuclease D